MGVVDFAPACTFHAAPHSGQTTQPSVSIGRPAISYSQHAHVSWATRPSAAYWQQAMNHHSIQIAKHPPATKMARAPANTNTIALESINRQPRMREELVGASAETVVVRLGTKAA